MKKLSLVVIFGLFLAFVFPTTVFGDNYKGSIQLSNSIVNIYLDPIDINNSVTDGNVDSTGSYYTYVVQPGDNLGRIAESFCTTVQKLIVLNKLSSPNMIYVGQELKVRSTETLTQPIIYTVQPSDTIFKIAQKNGLTITDIVKANKIHNPNILYKGQKIVIPFKQSQPAAGGVQNIPSVQTVPNIYIMYIVKAGNTLFKIAKDNNTAVNALIKANNLNPSKYLFVGQKLAIPSTSSKASGQLMVYTVQ